jgi:hypothetical protein
VSISTGAHAQTFAMGTDPRAKSYRSPAPVKITISRVAMNRQRPSFF